MRSRLNYHLVRKYATRFILAVILFVLSGALCVSLLHIFAPRHEKAAVKLESQLKSSQPVSHSPVYSVPLRIKIDSLAVDAPVASTGLTDNNDMDISTDVAAAAWYKYGPKPGEVGSAVIAAHYGIKDGQRAIFSDLHLLKANDAITVIDEKGASLKFSVTEVRTYDLNDDATQVFTSDDGKARLNLITCSGTWNNSLQTYSDRFVVFTELVKP